MFEYLLTKNFARSLFFSGLVFLCFTDKVVYAQKQLAKKPHKTVQEYIDEFKEDAIREMHEDGVPASITLAQGIKESNAGNSPLAILANNHFGIKCQKEWNGPSYIQDDDAKDECFRKYETALQSYADHSDFLRSRPRYSFLFLLDIKDYKGWATGLKAAGYATDPNYANCLIKIIEDYKLYNLDTIKAPSPELVASIDKYFTPVPEKITWATKPVLTEKPSTSVYVKPIIEKINGRDVIRAREGDNLDEICNEFDMDPRVVFKYNELENYKENRFHKDQLIFLQPKRSRCATSTYTVLKGETLYSISQKFGIKLNVLCRKNKLRKGQNPSAGTTIQL